MLYLTTHLFLKLGQTFMAGLEANAKYFKESESRILLLIIH